MAATKITVNNNGSIRVEGDFEIVDPDRRDVRPRRSHRDRPVPLRRLRQQALLRRRSQPDRLQRPSRSPRLAAPEAAKFNPCFREPTFSGLPRTLPITTKAVHPRPNEKWNWPAFEPMRRRKTGSRSHVRDSQFSETGLILRISPIAALEPSPVPLSVQK